ncbi:hypothetical protein YC2023_019665 [Brassica napus]
MISSYYGIDEKLAVVHIFIPTLKIWIAAKIEPNEISWSSFWRPDMRLINDLPYDCMPYPRSFFIDEEKKLFATHQFHAAHIIGKDGYLKSVKITRNWEETNSWDLSCLPEETIEQVNQPDADDMKEIIVKQQNKRRKITNEAKRS